MEKNYTYTVYKVITIVDCGKDAEGTRLEGARVRKLYQEREPNEEFFFDVDEVEQDEI